MEALRPNLPLALFVLALFSAYLVTATLVSDRMSPPIFFTIALALTIAPFRPSLIVAALSIGGIVIADLLFALDHIVRSLPFRFVEAEHLVQSHEAETSCSMASVLMM